MSGTSDRLFPCKNHAVRDREMEERTMNMHATSVKSLESPEYLSIGIASIDPGIAI